MKHINKQTLPALLLRIGLATVFLYAAVQSLLYPEQWVNYLPTFIQNMSIATTFLQVFAAYEIVLALWLLSNKLVRIPALLAALTLAGILVVQPGNLQITFRDIGLACMALALAAMDMWPTANQ